MNSYIHQTTPHSIRSRSTQKSQQPTTHGIRGFARALTIAALAHTRSTEAADAAVLAARRREARHCLLA